MSHPVIDKKHLEKTWESILENPEARKKVARILAEQDESTDALNCISPKTVDSAALKEKYEGQSVFMAFLHRQNSISRWTKSQSIQQESLNDHCASVAYLGLLMGAYHQFMYPETDLIPERLAVFCLFHDSPESISEDVNGVLKSSDEKLRKLLKETEGYIAQKIAATIDPILSPFITPYFLMACTPLEKDFVKAADLLSAYAKAKCELRSNNADFAYAAGQLREDLTEYIEKYQAVKFVYDHYIKAYELTIDEMITFLPTIDDLDKAKG
ncbi:hypothetical protein EA58_14305 [Photobacterium galatheae]|uniref:5'-deoxynucleotidase n=1 Tax=Photobacterium galatheae TaxID=1654360 RepID=A0A066RU62_9GAMM|nr:hypothetical protein EA58_14305 [Photobacterium galatheae]